MSVDQTTIALISMAAGLATTLGFVVRALLGGKPLGWKPPEDETRKELRDLQHTVDRIHLGVNALVSTMDRLADSQSNIALALVKLSALEEAEAKTLDRVERSLEEALR